MSYDQCKGCGQPTFRCECVKPNAAPDLFDWRQRLRDFAEDSEQHAISRKTWKQLRGGGVTLYSDADYFTAYYGDAAILWDQADDELPMFHVMVQSDPPPRTVIHAIHLASWVQHLVGMAVPVLVVDQAEMEE